METKPKSKRGFASMDPVRQREIARLGGIRSHESGVAHRYTKEEASIAGKKGAAALVAKRGKEYFVELGRKGGSAPRK